MDEALNVRGPVLAPFELCASEDHISRVEQQDHRVNVGLRVVIDGEEPAVCSGHPSQLVKRRRNFADDREGTV